MLCRVIFGARRWCLFLRSKHRFKLLKAAGAEAMAANTAALWEEVASILSTGWPAYSDSVAKGSKG